MHEALFSKMDADAAKFVLDAHEGTRKEQVRQQAARKAARTRRGKRPYKSRRKGKSIGPSGRWHGHFNV